MKQKVELEKEKKSFIESAAEKEVTLKKKISTIGNIVHDSVPVNNDEVCWARDHVKHRSNSCLGLQRTATNVGT
jgi:seryl-tRNA synthetase